MKQQDRIKITIFRSNKYIYAQAIKEGLVIASDSSIKYVKDKKLNKTQQSKFVGLEVAKQLLKKKIKKAVLNRKRYAYHGRVKSLTEGLREGGLDI
ncbi:MAG: 50S ribosomal protein L18 [bacterium]